MVSPAPLDRERTRRVVGIVLYVLGTLTGGLLLQFLFLLPPLFEPNAVEQYASMAEAAALAFPAVLVYVTVPRLLDRYDPEPWWALMLVFVWGALGACGFAAAINSGAITALGGDASAESLISVVCAPPVEEFFKGLAVLGMFYFWRREFDGVVDGIIYGTFVALGFAAVENVVYYSRAASAAGNGAQALAGTFVLRGIVTPWAHPLFTSMTGLGFGLSRETTRTWVRWLAPAVGYAIAVSLHALWNGAAVLSTATNTSLSLLLLPLWLLFVLAFIAMLVGLVVRRGRIIRRHLSDEVLLGNLTREELRQVTSPFGSLRAGRSQYGQVGREFAAAAARLALSKWHAERAMQGQTHTVSLAWIEPLRKRLSDLRAQMYAGRTPRVPVAAGGGGYAQPPGRQPPAPWQPRR